MAAHLSVEEIARYVDGASDPGERVRIETHVADCTVCGDEILNVSTATRNVGGGSRLALRAGVAIAAAAVVAALLLVGGGALDTDGTGPRFRDPGHDLRVRVLRPADGATVDPSAMAFVWRPIVDGAFYNFTFMNDVGDILWQGETNDTVQTLRGQLVLRGGARYFWRVEALLPDGRSADTGAHEIVVAR